jgi:hypothetical protein
LPGVSLTDPDLSRHVNRYLSCHLRALAGRASQLVHSGR